MASGGEGRRASYARLHPAPIALADSEHANAARSIRAFGRAHRGAVSAGGRDYRLQLNEGTKLQLERITQSA